MTDVREATAEFLQDHPDLEAEFEELIAVDAANASWSFDDIPLDSGGFGELVSRDIVEKHDGEYRLRDRGAVERALGTDDDETSDNESETDSESNAISIPDPFADTQIDRTAAFGLTGALALVILFRVLPFASVFRNGDVTLSGNDPYAYRYLVHQLLAEGGSAFDLSVLSSLPSGVSHGEPLYVATMWWASALLGGAGAADYVLAVFPVISAVVTALLVYVLTLRVTADKRVSIAAVALLAVIPGHAFRTGLGFADHHAFDYPWLALTALAVVSIAGRDLREKRTIGWVLALGVGVGGQVLAWDAGPLLLVPIALYVAAVVPSWILTEQSPLVEGAPLVGGLAIGTAITLGGHYGFGWHSIDVVLVPALLLCGIVSVLTVGAFAQRFELSSRTVFGVEIASGIVGFLTIRAVFPSFATRLDDGIDFLLNTEGIAETASLVSGQLGNIIGPVFLFGFALFLALPYLAWTSLRCYRRHSPEWLAVSCYAWYFIVLALVQIRFVGQLALFVALFGGLGFVHLAAWVDLTSYPRVFVSESGGSSTGSLSGDADATPEAGNGLDWPERRDAMYTAGLGLGVASLGTLMTPIKHSQASVDDATYEAAAFMREYAAERGWEYPESYVFSSWSNNRVYNWFVNGESRSYAYARSNFEDFVTSPDGQEWYERMRNRIGFVVVGDGLSSSSGEQSTYERLRADNLGLETDHYRAVWTAGDDSRRVYTLVPGARVTGLTNETGSVPVEGNCEIDGEQRSVSMDHSVGDSGVYDVTIPLPGTYAVGENDVSVSEEDVLDGTLQSSFDGEGEAYWSFDEGTGDKAYDRTSGRHATITNGEWVEGVKGSAIAFDGEGHGEARPMEGSTEEFTVSAWIKPETESSGAILSTGKDGSGGSETGILFDHGLSQWNDDRLGMYLGTGDSSHPFTSRKLNIEYPAETYYHVAVVFDRGTIHWYLDGELLGTNTTEIRQVVHSGDKATYIGREFSGQGGTNNFRGSLDEIRYYETALDDDSIAALRSER